VTLPEPTDGSGPDKAADPRPGDVRPLSAPRSDRILTLADRLRRYFDEGGGELVTSAPSGRSGTPFSRGRGPSAAPSPGRNRTYGQLGPPKPAHARARAVGQAMARTLAGDRALATRLGSPELTGYGGWLGDEARSCWSWKARC